MEPQLMSYMASTQIMAMPMKYGRQNASPKWVPLTYGIIKNTEAAKLLPACRGNTHKCSQRSQNQNPNPLLGKTSLIFHYHIPYVFP